MTNTVVYATLGCQLFVTCGLLGLGAYSLVEDNNVTTFAALLGITIAFWFPSPSQSAAQNVLTTNMQSALQNQHDQLLTLCRETVASGRSSRPASVPEHYIDMPNVHS